MNTERTTNEIRLEAMLQEAIRQRNLCFTTGDDLIHAMGELAVLKAHQVSPTAPEPTAAKT